MTAPETNVRDPVRWALPVVFVLAVAVKVALLLTSQSLADGDEAVEGLMGMHILEGRGHPIYPYGVRYGAGAGLEAHVAAALFHLVGISSVTLKSVGLFWWSLGLLLVAGIGRSMSGPRMALAASVLYGFSPAAAQWSLKVSGGHQVAVVLCLLMILLHEKKVSAAWIVPLAPLAAFAHPIALPFAALFAVVLVARERRPALAAGSLLLAAGLCFLLLYRRLPEAQEAWNPVSRGFAPGALLRRLAVLPTTFFSPNLNATTPTHGFVLVVSLVWQLAFVASLVQLKRSRLALYAAAVLPIVFLVHAPALAARHLLVLQPIACLVIARAGTAWGRVGPRAVGALALLGCAVQVNEMRSPMIHGAGWQEDGVVRSEVRGILERLEQHGVHHVYNAEPMLSWILMFESREEILARWLDPDDRVQAYAQEVDAARRAGSPVALVKRAAGPGSFEVVIDPDPADLARFRPAAERPNGARSE